MKIKDLLNESATDIVARFYKEASTDSERFHNPDSFKYKNKNKEFYTENFKDWYNNEVVPVFTKPKESDQPKYNVVPEGSKLQSPGHRGLQYSLAAAGIPYDKNVQKFNPAAPAVVSSELDSIRNANGQ